MEIPTRRGCARAAKLSSRPVVPEALADDACDLEQELAADRLGKAVVAVGGDDEARRAADDLLRERRLEIIAVRPAAAAPAEDGEPVDHDVGGERRRPRLGDRDPA